MNYRALGRILLAAYIVLSASGVYALLGCAVLASKMHGEVNGVPGMRALAILVAACALLALLMLVGEGDVRRAMPKLVLWGYVTGLSIGLVSGWCLFKLALLMDYTTVQLTFDFFSIKRVLAPVAVTIPTLVAGKIIWATAQSMRKEKG